MELNISANDLELILIGLIVVMLALAGNAIVTAFIGMIFKGFDNAAKKKAVATPKTPASDPNMPAVIAAATAVASQESTTIAAVIAASVATVLGDTEHRIVSIEEPDLRYSRAGRREHFDSKNVIRRR